MSMDRWSFDCLPPIDARALETGRARVLFDPISAISAGTGVLGGVASLFGASKQAKAAKEAAALQAAAAAKAGQGVMDTATEHNKDIISSADRSSAAVSEAAARAGADVTAAAGRSNALLDPYRQSGNDAADILQRGIADGGRFSKTPTAADIQMDPGFEARLRAGQVVRERSAAARGGAASGTALMDLEHFAQTEQSSEYDKAFQRFRDNRTDAFNSLNTVAGRGFDAAGQEGRNTMGAATYSGDKTVGAATYGGDKIFSAANATADNANAAARANGEYITGGANAEAAGKVGAATAWNQGISGALGAAGTGAGVFNLLSNPTKYKPVANPGWVS